MLEMSQLQYQQRTLDGRGVPTEKIGQKIERCGANHDIWFITKVEECLAYVKVIIQCAMETKPHIP